MLNHFGQFIVVNAKKNIRKSQAQFREKLRNWGSAKITVFL